MKALHRILNQSKNQKEIIVIHNYTEDDTYFSGYVLDYTEEIIVLQKFSIYGRNDGVVLVPIADVQRVEYDNDFCQAIQILIDYGDELYKPASYKIDVEPNENPFVTQLKVLEGSYTTIVTLKLEEEKNLSGYLIEVEEEDLVIHGIGDMGEDLGYSVMKIHEITGLIIDDLDNRRRDLLYKWRTSLQGENDSKI